MIVFKLLNANQFYDVLEDIDFQMQRMNKEYTAWFLVIRYIFCFISCITFAIYMWQLSKIRHSSRTFEHRAIIFISMLLIFFDNPLIILQIYKPSLISILISVLFYTNFFFMLMLFWTVMLQRVAYEAGELNTKQFNAWNCCLISVILL